MFFADERIRKGKVFPLSADFIFLHLVQAAFVRKSAILAFIFHESRMGVWVYVGVGFVFLGLGVGVR